MTQNTCSRCAGQVTLPEEVSESMCLKCMAEVEAELNQKHGSFFRNTMTQTILAGSRSVREVKSCGLGAIPFEFEEVLRRNETLEHEYFVQALHIATKRLGIDYPEGINSWVVLEHLDGGKQ